MNNVIFNDKVYFIKKEEVIPTYAFEYYSIIFIEISV